MIERGYWRHVGSDRIWAVEIEDGRPVKCAGPFDARDVGRDILEYLDYSTTTLAPSTPNGSRSCHWSFATFAELPCAERR